MTLCMYIHPGKNITVPKICNCCAFKDDVGSIRKKPARYLNVNPAIQ